MQEAFDPYGAWLGLPPGPRPPDCYQLLGLAPFYPDVTAIATSADQRIAYVQQLLNGPQAPMAMHIVNELVAARNMLLNPQAKAAYDGELYRRMQGAAVPQYAPMQMAAPGYGGYAQPGYAQPGYAPAGYAQSGYAQQAEPSPPVVSVSRRRFSGKSKSSSSEMMLIILAVSVLAVIGLVGYLFWNRDRNHSTTQHAPVVKHTSTEVEPTKPKETKVPHKLTKVESHDSQLAVKSEHLAKSEHPATPSETVDSQESAAVGEALSAARIAISDRKFTVAETKLEAAKQVAHSRASKHDIENVRALLYYTRGFWNVVQSSWKNLTAGNELMVNGETIVIVEVTPDVLIIRAAGQNREYTVQRMPFSLALTLGEAWLTKGDPNSNVFLAAFHLSDYKGDRKKARQLLNQAAKAGIDVDGLLHELDLAEKK